MRHLMMIIASVSAAGCASTSTVSFSQDTVQVVAKDSLGGCDQQSLGNEAFRKAAEETIKRGYDRFLIVSGNTGGAGGGCQQALVVKMFNHGDPAGAKAFSAREKLGKDKKAQI